MPKKPYSQPFGCVTTIVDQKENEKFPVQCFELITNCVRFWYEKLFDPIQKSAATAEQNYVTSENINRFKYSVSL